MATYLMFGKYSIDALKGISSKRTSKAGAIIKKFGGELKSGFALLGKVDLVLIVELPDTGQAMKAAIALSKETGIAFSTEPAVSIEEFDRLMG